MLLICAVILFVVNIHKATANNITSELKIKHLKHHERVYFNKSESFTSSNIMQFDAFNQHYVIQLELVEHLIPADIIQHHRRRDNEIEPYYTSLTQSCHYHGRVLNTDDENAYAVLSFCPKRGIRGEVQAFGDKIYIKPTAAYEKQFRLSDLNEEHLIYRASDEIIEARADTHHNHDKGYDINDVPTLNTRNTSIPRRRLRYNSGKQTVEVLVINGAARTKWYQENKGSSWKQELNSDLGDLFSKIQRPYSSASWSSDIGSITIKLAQLDIMEDYGDVGKPSGSTLGSYNNKPCGSESEILKAECSVSEDSYLERIQNYIRKFDDYDTAALIDLVPMGWQEEDEAFSATLGYACLGCVCKSSAASVNFDSALHGGDANIGPNWGPDTTAGTVAHEIGHNLNMDHDGDGNNCNAEKYLMGDAGLSSGFSSCSRSATASGFSSNGGWNCLDGGGSSSSPPDDNDDAPPDDSNDDGDIYFYDDAPPDDDNDNGGGGSCSGSSCVEMSGMKSDSEGKSYNGQWEKQGCTGGYAYYTNSRVSSRYLCYDDVWVVTDKLCDGSEDYLWAYCRTSSSDLSKCVNYWKIWRGGNDYTSDSSVDISTSCNAFTFQDDEEAECLNGMDDTEIHIDGGSDVWDGIRVFSLVEGRCSNLHPEYYYATYNDDESVASIYYLHYVEEQNDGDTIGQWVISADEMFVVGDAYCIAQDLSECVINKWNVKVVQDDSIYFVLSEDMKVDLITSSVEERNNYNILTWIVVIGMLLVVVLLLVIIYIFMKKRGCDKRVKRVGIDDESADEIEVEIEAEEVNVFTNTTDTIATN